LPSAKYRPKITSPMNAPTCRRCVPTYSASSLIFTRKLQISPLIVSGFKNGFHQWIQRISLVVVEAERNFCPEIFFGFQNLDALYRPVAGKPFVLEDLCLDMGTSVASALTAETIFEIIKCMSDVDMPARVRMGSKIENFEVFSILATPTIEMFRFLDVVCIQGKSEHVN